MGIWDRLGNVLKSYINTSDEKVFGKTASQRHYDPDLDAAYEELDDFLRGTKGSEKAKEQNGGKPAKKPMPEEVKMAFAELGLTPEATAGECKDAYKKLLKIHHPDRHAKHEGNMKKATGKTSRVNAAYERLMKWFRE
jgi:DnaJ-domain-containing protein 1